MAMASAPVLGEGEKMVISTGNFVIEALQGDITTEETDAIVNPTNRLLYHDRGVSLAVSFAAGPKMQEESTKFVQNSRPLDSGECTVTGPGNLKAKKVIHVVSPHYVGECNGDEETAEELLQFLYTNVFQTAINIGAGSVSMPGVGTGSFGIPVFLSASTAVSVLSEMVKNDGIRSLENVRFVDRCPLTACRFADILQAALGKFPKGACCFKVKDSVKVNVGSGSGKALSNGQAEFEKDEGKASGSSHAEDDEDKDCSICFEEFSKATPDNPVQKMTKCKHRFHKICIQEAFKHMQPKCPVCQTWYGPPMGNQPENGKMTVTFNKMSPVPGYQGTSKGAIVIQYHFPSGVQKAGDIRPGQPYSGTSRQAYLPNNDEGKRVLKLLQLAFDHRLVFTVGDSVTTGCQNTVVWNNIHHKTSLNGGPQSFGYPDPTYLSRVEEELAAAGITRDMIK